MRSGKKFGIVPVSIFFFVSAAVEQSLDFFNVSWTCDLLNGGKKK